MNHGQTYKKQQSSPNNKLGRKHILKCSSYGGGLSDQEGRGYSGIGHRDSGFFLEVNPLPWWGRYGRDNWWGGWVLLGEHKSPNGALPPPLVNGDPYTLHTMVEDRSG